MLGSEYSTIEDGHLGVSCDPGMCLNTCSVFRRVRSCHPSFLGRPVSLNTTAFCAASGEPPWPVADGTGWVVFLCARWQAVAPSSAFGRADASRGRTMGRATALVMVCGLAACVALLGGIGDAEEPVSQTFLAVKAELQAKPVVHFKSKVILLLALLATFAVTCKLGIACCLPTWLSRICAPTLL